MFITIINKIYLLKARSGFVGNCLQLHDCINYSYYYSIISIAIYFVFHTGKEVLPVWNNMRVSK